ncbi:MAG: AAA family ATPase [Euryarchaeota archaeon]|nr:AAA family ATPase [Euryarchaeota archaeon]MDE1879464.1 AAA family ATPase [Euryarchaeota archaeon]
MTFADELAILVKARRPVIWVVTHEEGRVVRMLADLAATGFSQPKRLLLWSLSTGVIRLSRDPNDANDSASVLDPVSVKDDSGDSAVDPVAAIQFLTGLAKKEPSLIVMRDLHRFWGEQNPTYRFLRDMAEALRESKSTVIVTSPVSTLPVELQKDVTMVDMPLPTLEELGTALDSVTVGLPPSVSKKLTNGEREKVLKAGRGLTEDEFKGVVCESVVRSQGIDPALIVRAKEQLIRQSGVMELYTTTESLALVGGLDRLKAWGVQRARAFTEAARKFGLRPPRGLFLLGPPGTGKTQTAKAFAAQLGVPLLWVKADAIFSKYVGESEQNLRRVLNIADAVAPAILFFDEVEKLLAGAGGNGNNDSGVTKRVFGSILTWMQEHTSPVLVIATANQPLAIPPELMGRFDACFFVDLPTATELREILAIHLHRVGRSLSKKDVGELAEAAAKKGLSGREVERAVNEALFYAFEEERDLQTHHVGRAIAALKALSETRRAEVQQMREWAKVNALPASGESRSEPTSRGSAVEV